MPKKEVEKVGVAWTREFKGGKCIKISLNGSIFMLYENKKKSKETDPDFVICKFLAAK